MSPDGAFSRLGARPAGLDTEEVAHRQKTIGPNRLPDEPPRSRWAVLRAQFKGFLTLLLFVAAVVAWVIGDLKNAIMIGAVTIFNAGLGFLQEQRAERALAALKRMVAFRTRVRRGGQVAEVAAENLVPGNVALLEAGDRVPAADGSSSPILGAPPDDSPRRTPQRRLHARLWTALRFVVVLQVPVVYWSPLQDLFGMAALRFRDWALCVGAVSTVLIAEELRKLVARALHHPGSGVPATSERFSRLPRGSMLRPRRDVKSQ